MKKSPTLLMKELSGIEKQIERLENDNVEGSLVPVDEHFKPLYESTYSFDKNRQQLKGLFKRQLEIKTLLNNFNIATKVTGYDLTIAEALVKIAQLKTEVKTLDLMLARKEYVTGRYDTKAQKICYNLDELKELYNKLNNELSALRAAVDTINLTSQIEY